MNDKKRAGFIVSGLVQGVGFRYFVYRHALELGLEGYATNLYDGTVMVVVEGKEDSIRILHEYLKKGPSHSYVESVRTEYSESKDEFSNFTIK